MNLKSILATVGRVAVPTIAAAALPGSPLIGIAAKFISDKLGVPPIEPTAEAIDKVIAADPDAMLKLQQSEQEFKEYMAKLGFDSVEKMEELANADRADARAREVAVKDNTPRILAYADLAMFLTGLIVLIMVPIPPAIHDLVLIMVTTIANNVVQERSYYFGSSTGSHSKDAALIAATTSTTNP